MKLAYLAYARLPTEKAHGTQIMKTCEALVAAGVLVELIVPTRRNALTEDPFSYYRIPERFPLTFVSAPDFVRFGPVGFVFSLMWYAYAARARRSVREADVVYSRDHLVLLPFLSRKYRVVFEAHAKPTRIMRFVARRAERVVVISEALARTYREVGVPTERVVLAPDAVDPNLFNEVPSRKEVRAALRLPEDASIVAYVGHLYERKGAQTVARAAEQVPEAQFVFVGGTESDLFRFRREWGSHTNIRIEGHVPPERVPWYLRAADTLVIPNSAKDEDSARYTSPMKLFEYMESGTPIVASDVPALREVLSDASARFVEADNPDTLASGLRTVLTNPKEAAQMAVAAKKVAASYTWKQRAEKIRNTIIMSA